MSRLTKQLIIGAIFIILLGGVSYGFFGVFTSDPTCYDGIQNQTEQGVDCGVVCGVLCLPAPESLQVKATQLLPAGNNEYDLVLQISNPNTIYGSEEVVYDVILKNDAGQEVRRHGLFYILPGQTRFIVESKIISTGHLELGQVAISEPQWYHMQGPEGLVDFPLKREQYRKVRDTLHEFEGVILNNSDFDFDQVDLTVLLVGPDNTLVGATQTNIRTILARTERGFKVSWPFALPAAVQRVQVEATTNVFKNSNFLRTYGTPERFQSF
ncbi:MAG: hypothetical protein KW806_00800 [Candidatus Yanofskybacteria bacterium]|nr:hypothetical protein [Candidatus Yanofskybacteria bacterium]